MVHHDSWKPIYFGDKRSKIKVTRHKNSAGVGFALLWVLASSISLSVFFIDLKLLVEWQNGPVKICPNYPQNIVAYILWWSGLSWSNSRQNGQFYKWPKNFGDRLYWGGGGFFTEDNIMRHQTVGSIALRRHAIIEYWMIPFVEYTAAEILDAFQCFWQPQKLPLPVGDLDPI